MDSILSFDIGNYEDAIGDTIRMTREKMGDKIAQEVIVNIRDEYPTYDWILENMLVKTGFSVDKIIRFTGLISVFISTKTETNK